MKELTKAWLDKYYPVRVVDLDLDNMTQEQIVEHSLVKWRGVRDVELWDLQADHWTVKEGRDAILSLSCSSCSLCRKHYNEWNGCPTCPIVLSGQDSCNESGSAYLTGATAMVRCLEKTLDWVKGNQDG